MNDYDIESENTYYAQLEFKEKGWKKHQRIATEASIASKIESVASNTFKPNMPMSPSIASTMTSTAQTIIDRDKLLKQYQHKSGGGGGAHRSSKNNKKMKSLHTQKETEKTNEYNGYIDYHSDSDDFGVFDIADFAKQINKKSNRKSASSKYEQQQQKKKQKLSKEERRRQKKEKKRLEKERKRKLKEKEREIEEIERKMYSKKSTAKSIISSKTPSKRSSSSKYKTIFDQNKPKVITMYTTEEDNAQTTATVTKLNDSQTSPARAGIFEFDSIPNISAAASAQNQEIDTEDFHIVVVGSSNHSHMKLPSKPMINKSASQSATIPSNIPSNLEAPPSIPPFFSDTEPSKVQQTTTQSKKECTESSSSSSNSSSSDENELNVDDLVISEMAPSPSTKPIDSFDASPVVHNASNVNLRKYGNDRRPVIDNKNEHQYVPSMVCFI